MERLGKKYQHIGPVTAMALLGLWIDSELTLESDEYDMLCDVIVDALERGNNQRHSLKRIIMPLKNDLP